MTICKYKSSSNRFIHSFGFNPSSPSNFLFASVNFFWLLHKPSCVNMKLVIF
nr:MAG TPA: hypothetical protein [Bacteriophage sp.]